MVWRENNREVDELIVTHLPAGPTAIFKINNVKLNKVKIKLKLNFIDKLIYYNTKNLTKINFNKRKN